MFILNLFRYIKGYVRFTAQGVFVERFLNLCARNRIPVWNGRKRGEEWTGCTAASSYPKMRALAARTGVKIRIVEKQGAPFQRRRYRKRTGLVIGLALFVAFLALISRFIWRIEINGNESVPEARIISVLDEIGIRPGVLRSSIDVRDAERRAMLGVHELSWVALNIEGSTIHVEVSESIPPPEMVDPNKPCNIVASMSGQIVALHVYDGQALVRKGDTVMEGDIIVSGITEDRSGQHLYRHALADVIAEVQTDLTVEVRLQQTEYQETGRTTVRRYLSLPGFDLPLFLPFALQQPYRVERENRPARLFGSTMPFGMYREEYILMEEVPIFYTEGQAQQLAMRELDALEKVRLDGANITQRTMEASLNGDIFILRAHYICTMEIGEEREILFSGEDIQ